MRIQDIEIIYKGLCRVSPLVIRDSKEITHILDSQRLTGFIKTTERNITKNIIQAIRTINNYEILTQIDETKNNYWLIDAINGKENFSHGINHFCTLVGYIVKKKFASFIIYDYIKEDFFWWIEGKEVFENKKKVKTNLIKPLNPMILTDYPCEGEKIRRTGCEALDIAYVISGRPCIFQYKKSLYKDLFFNF